MITRSISDLTDVEGRTLSGHAFLWDLPNLVRDPGSKPYKEAFDRAIEADGVSVPLLFMHPFSGTGNSHEPLGVARFRKGDKGLEFEAEMAATRRADEFLELVRAGATKDVSVGFIPVASAKRGDVTYRTNINLRELSLVPTGFAAHPGAAVESVRSEGAEYPRLERVRRRLILLG